MSDNMVSVPKELIQAAVDVIASANHPNKSFREVGLVIAMLLYHLGELKNTQVTNEEILEHLGKLKIQ